MRHTYLIARREYLSYVATPGFWLSLAMVPVFMLLGIAVPIMLDRSTPTRYFTVLDQSGRYETAIVDKLERDRTEQARTVLKSLSTMPGQGDSAARALAALDAGQSLKSAEAMLGAQAKMAMGAIKENYILVSAPVRTEEQIRPFLLGEETVSTPAGSKPLYAAVFIKTAADGSVSIDYWSTAITTERLKNIVRRAVRDEMRTEAFARAGLETEIVRTINAMEPRLFSLSPEKAADDAEVTASDKAPFIAAVMFAFVLWMIVFSVANMLLTSTIEEKSGKVLDSLLCSAPIRSLLTGKLLGVAAVSFTLLAGWAIAGAVAAGIGGQLISAGNDAGIGRLGAVLGAISDPALVLPFFGYFIFGYLMFGSIFLALGSLCETLQEAQTLMSPVIFTLMVPMLVLAFVLQEPNSPILAIISWIPLFTPFIMLARLPADPPLIEILGTTAVMILTTVLVLWAAGRVFQAGAMHQAGVDYFKKLLRFGRAKPARTKVET